MNTQEMETRIKELEQQVVRLKDMEAIQTLQKSYGHFIQHWMYEEIVDLFADGPQTEVNLIVGIYVGKESVKRYYTSLKDYQDNPEFLHQLMQLSGIIEISPDGKTATGRWFTLGSVAMTVPDGVRPLSANGLYDMEYVKQDGVWKILKLIFHPLYLVPPGESWVKKERTTTGKPQLMTAQTAIPDKPREIDSRYPSGYIVPFNYKHPVTGQKINVEKHNSALKKPSGK